MHGLSAKELLSKLRTNDREFIGELRIIVESMAQRWNWSGIHNAEDIAQDCFLKLIQNLESGAFRGQSSLKTYLYAIVRNTCIDYYKAGRVAELIDCQKVVLADPRSSPEERIISGEERMTACRVLLALPRECRRLWRTIFFGGCTYRQAAERLGLTEGTVKRKMWECRQMAHRKVAEFEK